MINYRKFFLLTVIFFLWGFFVVPVHAATLVLLPESGPFNIGQEFTVNVKIKSEDVSINASQAVIEFPTNSLELVSVSKTNSVFNFWIEEPTISNENGTLSFIGGTAKGVVGGSLHVLKLTFKATGSGEATIFISNALVAASDGKGTNVLSDTEEIIITVGTKNIIKRTTTVVQQSAPESAIKQPQKIVRTAIKSSKLPLKPKVHIPLYPDQEKWYNHIGDTIALWELPDDTVQVATRFSQSRDQKPGIKEDGLFNGKSFGSLEEGIWYVRVQFRNNVGWGDLTYYKISLDTTTPLQFEAEIDAEISNNPAPTITFETQDSLSGISHWVLYVDNKNPIIGTSTSITLSAQKPGEHTVLVRVFDKAGNSVEDDLLFEIIPLPTPFINYISKSISQGEFIFASGSALPNVFIDVILLDSNDREVFRGEANSDELGNWEVIIEEPLAKGKYNLSVISRDERGALSFPTEAEELKIKAKIIISIGFLDLGWFEIFLVVLLIIAVIISIILWRYVLEQQTRRAYQVIVGRDIEKMGNLFSKDLKRLEESLGTHPDSKKDTELQGVLVDLKTTVVKMKKYLKKELERLY